MMLNGKISFNTPNSNTRVPQRMTLANSTILTNNPVNQLGKNFFNICVLSAVPAASTQLAIQTGQAAGFSLPKYDLTPLENSL